MKKLLSFLLLLNLNFPIVFAQPLTIGVQGSSTANGVGATSTTTWYEVPDSAWVPIVNRWYKQKNLIDTFHKRAASAMDIYNGMWTGYVPPPGRNQPNIAYNCNALLSRVPKVDIAIIAYPSASYDVMTIKEVIERLNDLKRFYNDQGVVCYMLSTQPRDNFSFENRRKLKLIKDTMMRVFGRYAIDVYTGIADTITYLRKSEFAAPNDPIHLNNKGHRFIAEKIIEHNIIQNFSPLPIVFKNVQTFDIDRDNVRVEFELEDVEADDVVYVAISTDGRTFQRQAAFAIIPKKKYYVIIKRIK